MAFSSYQIDRLIEHLRRWRGWLTESTYYRPVSRDTVRVSPEGAGMAQGREGPAPPRAGGIPDLGRVEEEATYNPRVESERERRAGRFMRPPYGGPHPPEPIPRLRRREDQQLKEKEEGRRIAAAD